MKILQVIDKLDVGGAEKVFINLTNLLYKEGINVSVLIFINNGKLQGDLLPQINIIQSKRDSKFSLKTFFFIANELKKYDIIHVHMRHVYKYIKVISLVFNLKINIILHDHSSNFTENNFLLKTVLKPKFYIGVSNKLTNWAKKSLKVNNSYLLQNVVPQIKNNKKTVLKKGIVLVGNIKPDKNQLFAIRLLPYLDNKLTIIGKIQDNNYFETLQKEIIKLSLEGKVTFIFNEYNVQSILNEYQCAINVSKRESGPLVLIEYLAQNLPFLSYFTGDISLKLKPQLPNFFINNFNYVEWLKKLKLIDANNQNLIEIYNNNFSTTEYIKECLNIYQKIENY